MPVNVVDITFLDGDFNTITTGVDYLNGSIGDKVTAEITLDIHWEAKNSDIASADYLSGIVPCIVTFNAGVTKILRADGGSFLADGFNAYDTIVFDDGSQTTFQIEGIVTNSSAVGTNNEMRVTGSPIAAGNRDAEIYGITPITDFDFYYGLPANNTPNDTIISLVDGSVPKYTSQPTDYTNVTPVALSPSNSVKSWVYDLNNQNSTIEGNGTIVDVNKQRFKITHEFYIQPVFREQDLNTTTSPLSLNTPSFLDATQSIKYTFKVEAKYTVSSTNAFGTTVSFQRLKSTSNGNYNSFIQNGNVGYFDENGNGNSADYSLNSIAYTETLNNTPVQSMQPNAETNVSITLNSDSGAFANADSKFIIHIYRTPSEASTYSNLPTDIKENLLVSRQLLKINDVPTVSGNGFIKAGATVGLISFNQAILNFTFLPTFFLSQDNVTADLQAFNNDPANVADGYLIFVTCQDKDITNKGLSDKVAVLCDVNTAEGISLDEFYNTDGVCETTMLFNDHPTNNALLAFTDYKGWVEDSVVTKSTIRILKTNNNQSISGNTIQNVWNLNNLILRVEAQNILDTSRSFVLEESQMFTNGVDVTATRDFILPIGSPQNEIIWTTTDDVTHFEYFLQYPFKIRWEDWKTLAGVDIDFVPNNDWVQYINSEWNIKVNLYKEIDLAQEPETAASPCGLVEFKDANYVGGFVYFIDGTGQNPTTTCLETDTSQTGINVVFAITPANNETATICIDAENAGDINTIQFTGSEFVTGQNHPTGVMDFSVLTGLTTFNLGNHSLTSLIMPTTTVPTIKYEFANIDFDLDLSACTNLANDIRFMDGLANILTLPSTPNAFTLISIVNNPNLNQIDLTGFSGNSSGAGISLFNNGWSAAIVNQTLIDLDATGWLGGASGFINIQNNSAPTGAGLTAKTNLTGKNWLVITD
jgi:hypothetical protein